MTTLSNYWHAIAVDREVTDQPRRYTLVRTDLVAFRTEAGEVRKCLGRIQDVEAPLP